ncbi:UNVERIFIED_ORG: hypothetical protein ABIC81_002868 [Bacillus proteolyticus]
MRVRKLIVIEAGEINELALHLKATDTYSNSSIIVNEVLIIWKIKH